MKTVRIQSLKLGLTALAFGMCVATFGQNPTIATITLSGTDLELSGSTGQSGGTYFVLSSTSVPLPLSQWARVASNVLGSSGNFTITVTNAFIPSSQQRFYILQLQSQPAAGPAGMALIPAGEFTMGDTLDGESDAIPISVTVAGFYMDTNLVSYSQWQSVYSYATNHGYGFDNPGAGKAANHPVQTVNWYDVVKWSNARSQHAGLTAVYYTDAGTTQVFTNGDVEPYVNWGASGYRLPAEAEWEKAARGGLSGLRFPWGDTISESQANYDGETNVYSYDLGPNGYNAAFDTLPFPYTSPVGYFAANGYGLYDMAGNVYEWCWDWYGTPYGQPTTTNPTGVATGSHRVLRGGDWLANASAATCALRSRSVPLVGNGNMGFRCVKRP